MTPAEIVKRAQQLKQQRSNVEGVWSDIDRYVAPLSGGDMYMAAAAENAHNWSTRDVWDATAPIGSERLAAAFYAGTVNNYQRWFRMGFPFAKLNQASKARTWLDETSERMFIALVASNFGLETASGMRDLVSYGNTAIFHELADPKTWKGFQFSAVPAREILFEEDWRGRVLRWWRIFQWTPAQIISKFCPDPNAPNKFDLVPEMVWKRAEAGDDNVLKVVFCVCPNEKPGAGPMQMKEKTRAKELRPFCGCYVLEEGAQRLGEEEGYYEMPGYVVRYLRSPGSRWGYGPGTLALPTVKFLNAWMEAYLDSAEKAVDPATLVTERGLLSDLNLQKGGLTTVRSLEDIKPFESAARFDVAAQIILELRDMVRRHFREDDLQLKDSPAMTATEAQIREARTNRVLASPVGRVQNDYFDPMLQTTFNMMYREGQIDDPPPEVLEGMNGREIQIEYLGPLMRSQRSDDVAGLERLASGVAAMKKMGFEEVSDVFDAQQVVRSMAEFLSTPGNCLRDAQTANQRRAQREQLQVQMAQAQTAKTIAEGNRAQAGAMESMNGPQA